MNNTANSKETGYLQSGDHGYGVSGSSPLLQATDLETPSSTVQPPGYNGNEVQHTDGYHDAFVTEQMPVLEVNKAFDFTGHVDCTFEKVFPEAKGSRSVDAVSRCMNTLFSLTQRVTYIILTILIGTFLVVLWAIVFAASNFIMVWILQPTVKLFFLFLRLGGEMCRVIMRSTTQPFFLAASVIYSNFKGNFNVNVTAQEPLTPDDLPIHPV